MLFRRQFPPLALAALFSLAGCGGGESQIVPAGRATITVVGGAEGAFVDGLASTSGLRFTSPGDDLASADAILIDGDHIAPAGLGAVGGLRSAAVRGVPIIAVDASADLKAALAEALGAAGTTGGKSHAIGFVNLPGWGDHGFRIVDVPVAPITATSQGVEVDGEKLRQARAVIVTIPTVVNAATVASFRSALRASADGPPLPIPPAEVPHFYTEFSRAFGGVPNATISNQIDSAQITHRFLGYLDRIGPGDYRQYVVELTSGSSSTGELKSIGAWNYAYHYGWSQSMQLVQTKFEAKSSTSSAVEPVAFTNLHGGEDQFLYGSFYARYISAGQPQSWSAELRWNDLDLNGWIMNAGSGSEFIGSTYSWQRTPFDGLQEDYHHAWYGQGSIKPYPASSLGTKRFYHSFTYEFLGPVTGWVNVYPNLVRRYVDAWINSRDQAGGKVDFNGGSEWQYRLNFTPIAPPKS